MNRFTHLCPARLGSQLRFLVTRRSLRLTSDGTRFLLFTIGIGVAAVNTGNNLFYLLLAMMLSIVVISGLLSEQCLRRLDFHRHVPDLIMANQPTTVTLSTGAVAGDAGIKLRELLHREALRLLEGSA